MNYYQNRNYSAEFTYLMLTPIKGRICGSFYGERKFTIQQDKASPIRRWQESKANEIDCFDSYLSPQPHQKI
jgi:hypothetical protein